MDHGPQDAQLAPKGDQPSVAPEAPGTADDLTVPSPKLPAAPATGPTIPDRATAGETSLSIPAGVVPAEALRQPSAAAPIPGATAVAAEKKDITGSISRPVAPLRPMPASEPAPASPPHGASTTSIDNLPAQSGQLADGCRQGPILPRIRDRTALCRRARGAQNLAEARIGFDRAAKQGLAPAQFRLGGFYEKGSGEEKTSTPPGVSIRRRRMPAIAKAMHNLAVLYAEGIDASPDYQNAAKWFARRPPMASPTANTILEFCMGAGSAWSEPRRGLQMV